MRGEGLAVVGLPPGVHPGADPLRVAERGEGPLRLPHHYPVEELLGEPAVEVARVSDPRELDPEQGADHLQGPPLAEPGVPLAQGLHVAGDGAVHPVEAAVPEVVLGQDEVEAVCEAGVVVAAEGGEGGAAGPRGDT